jgi:menaquinone-dependent protoporphyrinogen oxidase
MSSILVVYATVDGQAARIAERIGAALRKAGHAPEVRNVTATTIAHVAAAEAVIIGGSIRYGHYPKALEAFVRDNRDTIQARPNAFYSVCLSAGGPGARPATALGYVDDFITRSGWQPGRIASFAGALLYTRYNPFIRFMMRIIVGMAGGNTDASRDYEYTDWDAVERFAAEFEMPLRTPQAA